MERGREVGRMERRREDGEREGGWTDGGWREDRGRMEGGETAGKSSGVWVRRLNLLLILQRACVGVFRIKCVVYKKDLEGRFCFAYHLTRVLRYIVSEWENKLAG